MPRIITSVPTCPADGCTLLINPIALYVQHPLQLTVAPLSAVSTTDPSPTPPARARTITTLFVAERTSARTPPSVTLASTLALPRSLAPLIVTKVPSCPLFGCTEEIVPSKPYVHILVPTTIEPVSDRIRTSPSPTPLELEATTVIRVLFADRTAATTPLRVTLMADDPPPSKLEPAMVTSVLN